MFDVKDTLSIDNFNGKVNMYYSNKEKPGFVALHGRSKRN